MNNVLRKNRRVLEGIRSWRPDKNAVQVDRQTLIIEGLHFDFFTGELLDYRGWNWRFCYDFGYADIGNESFIVMEKSALESQLTDKLTAERREDHG